MTFVLAVAFSLQTVSQPFVFRTEVRRVYVDAFVTRDGRPVAGLAADDFEIFDDGIVQRDVTLVEARDRPLSAVLLVDTSSSVRGRKLERLTRAAHGFMDGLTAQDEVHLMTFGTRYRVRETHAIDSMTSAGATTLWDSLYAATILAEIGVGRPFVVLFSDGEDNSSWLSSREILRTVETSPAVVYAVRSVSGAGVRLRSTESREAGFAATASVLREEHVLAEVVQAAAGRLVDLESAEALPETFAQILSEMRSRYLLTYEPAEGAPEGWHVLEVRLKSDAKSEVRARTGYFLR